MKKMQIHYTTDIPSTNNLALPWHNTRSHFTKILFEKYWASHNTRTVSSSPFFLIVIMATCLCRERVISILMSSWASSSYLGVISNDLNNSIFHHSWNVFVPFLITFIHPTSYWLNFTLFLTANFLTWSTPIFPSFSQGIYFCSLQNLLCARSICSGFCCIG